jgi:hypothetical protein
MMPELKLRPPIEKGKELWVGLNRLRNKFRDCHFRPHMSGIHRTAPRISSGLSFRDAWKCNDVSCAVEFGDGGECLPKKRVCAGDSCERCHGGTRAVERERASDKAETSPHRLKPGCGANTYGTTKVAPSRIVNPAGLSRERQVEVCAQCHGGIGESAGAFSYVEKCQECHTDSDCGKFAKLGARIRDNCIDCHMPVQESNLIIHI